jgi:hypothetical protein
MCKSNPEVIGDCFFVHGRLTLGNGNPTWRIWRVGTKRMLGVLHDENPIMPPWLRKYISTDDNIVYGDFNVCPMSEERPGWMRFVCIEDATNLVIEHYNEKTKEKKVYRIQNH